MTREQYRAMKKARGLSDDELMERLETGARMAALDTTYGRALVRESHRRRAAELSQ